MSPGTTRTPDGPMSSADLNDSRLARKMQDVWQAAQKSAVARDWTHPLYRYSASMAPSIARSLVKALTVPGDVILDPFCGGGTTAIEALAHGRRVICSDLNNLACFVTRAKASPLTNRELSYLRDWVNETALPCLISGGVKAVPLVTANGGRYAPHTHALLLKLRDTAEKIQQYKVRQIAKLVILRSGQLCFDCRQKAPSPSRLSRAFLRAAQETIEKADEYSRCCTAANVPVGNGRRLRVFCSDAERVRQVLGTDMHSIACVLTSPPYPGVHVLYHRWQFRGRKEISLPYTLAGLRNGDFESHYTMGSRSKRGHDTYFQRLRRVFGNMNQALRPGTILAQVVGFSHDRSLLQRYLDEMRTAGFEEVDVSVADKRFLQRPVPNRRWYIRTGSTPCPSKEYILLHRSTAHVSS